MELYSLIIKINFKGRTYNKSEYAKFSSKMLTGVGNNETYFSPDFMLTKSLFKVYLMYI